MNCVPQVSFVLISRITLLVLPAMRDKETSWVGMVFAAGLAAEFYPTTAVVPKGLLPVYDKPLIYYPLSTLMLAGIRRIGLVAAAGESSSYHRLLGNGRELGLEIEYFEEPELAGPVQSLVSARRFIGKDHVALILGDLLILADHLQGTLKSAMSHALGAAVFVHPVTNPELHTVVALRDDHTPKSIDERPDGRASNLAIMGISFYDNGVFDIIAGLSMSQSHPVRDIDVHRAFLKRNLLHVHRCGRGFAWLDTSTHSHLSAAANFIEALESNHGLKIGCLEEIAYQKGILSTEELKCSAARMQNGYGDYLRRLIQP